MQDGEFSYYTIQHRKTHESQWGSPNAPLAPVPEQRWSDSNFDVFGKYLTKDMTNEASEVYFQVDRHGFWTLETALLAVQLLQQASKNKRFDDDMQSNRYEFRAVFVVVEQKSKVVE